MVSLILLGLNAWTMKTIDGKIETLSPAQDRRATIVFVVLAECPIARGYSPEIARIEKDYRKKGVRFLMAFADGTAGSIRGQMKAFHLPFPAVMADRATIKKIAATTAPTAALIDSQGNIAYVGRIDDRFPALGIQRKPRRADLRVALDQFLTGQKVVPARTEVVGCGLPNG